MECSYRCINFSTKHLDGSKCSGKITNQNAFNIGLAVSTADLRALEERKISRVRHPASNLVTVLTNLCKKRQQEKKEEEGK